MSRQMIRLVLAAFAGLVPVLFAVMLQLTTGEPLPTFLEPYVPWSWPAVAVLALLSAGLTVRPRWGASDARSSISPVAAVVTTPIPAELPRAISDFTGRNEELAELRRRVGKRTLETAELRRRVGKRALETVVFSIDGKAGIGKSALAIHFAHQLIPRFPDAQLYVNLQGSGPRPLPPAAVLNQLLRALGYESTEMATEAEAAARLYRSRLGGERVIIVLDDAASEAQVRPLLPGRTQGVVLVTSRRPLMLEGATRLALGALPEREAVDLLGRVAGQARVQAEPSAAATVVNQCGQLPLALRVAGARLASRPAWKLEELAQRLADERRRLSELAIGDVAVKPSFELSYCGLNVAQARTFRLLGLVDVPSFTPEMVGALAETSVEAAEEYLEGLLDAQLLEQTNPGRYHIHDLLRIYARECADAEESAIERQASLVRALKFYLTTAEHFNNILRSVREEQGRREAVSWFEAERSVLVEAAGLAADLANDSEVAPFAWGLANALTPFLDNRKYIIDWQTVAQAGIRAARCRGDREVEATMLRELGIVYAQLLRNEQAISCFEHSLEILRQIGNRCGEGDTLNALAGAYMQVKRLDDAINCLTKSLEIAQDKKDRLAEVTRLNNLGFVCIRLGDLDTAIGYLGQSLTVAREIGDLRNEGGALWGFGMAHTKMRRFEDAISCFRQELAVIEQLGDSYGQLQTLFTMGAIYIRRGKLVKAAKYLRSAWAISREMGDRFPLPLMKRLNSGSEKRRGADPSFVPAGR
jgi:tetratricopeptide (TPR) repeat protein